MKDLHLNIEEVIGLQVTAEWRWRKAEESPNDPRNLEAANGSALHNRILELIDIVSEQGAEDEAIDTIESTEAKLHRVGFGGGLTCPEQASNARFFNLSEVNRQLKSAPRQGEVAI
jgi:hypothetical protein